MAESWTISEAARLCGCDRRTLQRAIHAGRLHLDAQYRLSREALLAAGYLSAETPRVTPQAEPQDTPQMASDLRPILAALERLIHTVEGVRQAVDTLRTEMRQRPHGTPQDTPQAPPQTDKTPQGTPQLAPRGTPHRPARAQGAPRETPHPTPQPHAGRPRSALGQRILALLGAHPEGLSAEQIRVYVSPERPIGDILSGMRRTGAVHVIGEGRGQRYVLTEKEL
jgi:helix-turn-helix protein